MIPPAMRFRGRLSIYEHGKYGFVARKWQKPGRPNPSAMEVETKNLFVTATQLVKQIDPIFIAAAKEATKGTAWTWKDYVISNMYGRWSEITLPDGTVMKGWRQLSVEAQALLDSIIDQVGSILVRTPSGWAGLDPGPLNDVLTSGGPSGLPSWQTPQTGGGAGVASPFNRWLIGGSTISIGANAYSFVPFNALFGATVKGAGVLPRFTSASVAWAVALYAADGTNGVPGTVLAQSATQTGFTSGTVAKADFTTAYTLGADELLYAALFTDTGGALQNGFAGGGGYKGSATLPFVNVTGWTSSSNTTYVFAY